jgi:hypothetical protein
VRFKRILWFIAALFVITCFLSGAWLGKTLSAMPPILTPAPPATERADQVLLRDKEREMAIATAIAPPAAILILLLTLLVISGMFTKDAATATPHTNSNPVRRETD